jgi:glycine betaine/proline transport system substrate-binding protein
MLAAGCSGGGNKNGKKISIAYANWAEGIAMTHLAKVALEEKGYEVSLKNADVAPIFASVATGKADVFMDAWMPVTHADYMNQYGDKLEVLGEAFSNARIGLVVPSYVTVDSLDELKDVKEKFDGNIVGIDAGAGIMSATEKVIDAYQLDMKLQSSSGPAMTALLKKSVEDKTWIVVTGWTPHWMFSRFDLKFLKDPKRIFGDAERIDIVATKGFAEKDPLAAGFFRKFKLTNEQMSDLMGYLADDTVSEAEGAKMWKDKNQELVEGWFE